MAELISFVVPTQSDKVLLVWELSAGPPAEALRVRGCAEGRGKGGVGERPGGRKQGRGKGGGGRGETQRQEAGARKGRGGERDPEAGSRSRGSVSQQVPEPPVSPGQVPVRAGRSAPGGEGGLVGTGFVVGPEVGAHVVRPPQHSLSAAFSQFGLLYSVRVFPNAAVARPGFYAIIKFYSSRDAQRAQRACDGKPLFQTSPVKVGADAGAGVKFPVHP